MSRARKTQAMHRVTEIVSQVPPGIQEAKKPSAQCIVFLRTQQVAKCQCLCTGSPVAICAGRERRHFKTADSGVDLNPSPLTSVKEDH